MTDRWAQLEIYIMEPSKTMNILLMCNHSISFVSSQNVMKIMLKTVINYITLYEETKTKGVI